MILTRGDYIGEAALNGLGRRTIGVNRKFRQQLCAFVSARIEARKAKKLLDNYHP